MTDITTHKTARRRLLIALAITSTFMVIQFIASFFANSMAVLADAGHLFVHNSSLVVALIASSIAIHLAKNYNTGYKKAELIGGLVNGIFYLAIAATIIFASTSKLINHENHNHEVDTFLMTAVSGLGFLFHAASAYVLYQGRKESVNVYAVFLHSFLDLLSTVLTFAAGIVIYFTGWVDIDIFSSIFIAGFVLITGFRVIKKCIEGLLESDRELPDATKIESRLSSLEHISSVHNVTVDKKGSKTIVGAHIVLKPSCTKEMHHELCQLAVEKCLLKEFLVKESVLQIEAHKCQHC
ncbi:cation diffusion facilitator family transporter [Pseudoalteromonas sp. G4]|uniref:cation diffusion facilitator family transporter n=1 Tax=Pseudoalteromonas sp. G4 TaxID=2992761 RepID=UPI00237ED64D|nr:cation diffusion facilitator family transporter [Pseudoalteromonas sp. G4]MDE3271929.1 cation diffusion facilitator family transporter [Pseudoalteromonas sp. G4]